MWTTCWYTRGRIGGGARSRCIPTTPCDMGPVQCARWDKKGGQWEANDIAHAKIVMEYVRFFFTTGLHIILALRIKLKQQRN